MPVPLDISISEAVTALIMVATAAGAMGFLLRPVLKLERRVGQISRLLALEPPDPGGVSLVTRLADVEADTVTIETRVVTAEGRLKSVEDVGLRLETAVSDLRTAVNMMVDDQGHTLKEIRGDIGRLLVASNEGSARKD